MFYRIKRSMVWLRRMRYSRGFGVQSPWAYRFIRYVINEHYPYYEYTHLNDEVYGINKFARKLCRLYFRVANYCQPKLVIDYGSSTTAYRSYFKAGCNSCKIEQVSADAKGLDKLDNILQLDTNVDVARVSLKGDYKQAVEKIIEHANRKSLLILQRINKNKETENYWKQLIADERTGVTFDLYYCGIIFFDHKKYKQNYIVNF